MWRLKQKLNWCTAWRFSIRLTGKLFRQEWNTAFDDHNLWTRGKPHIPAEKKVNHKTSRCTDLAPLQPRLNSKMRHYYQFCNFLDWIVNGVLRHHLNYAIHRLIPNPSLMVRIYWWSNITSLTSSAWIDSLIFTMKNREKYHADVLSGAIIIWELCSWVHLISIASPQNLLPRREASRKVSILMWRDECQMARWQKLSQKSRVLCTQIHKSQLFLGSPFGGAVSAEGDDWEG